MGRAGLRLLSLIAVLAVAGAAAAEEEEDAPFIAKMEGRKFSSDKYSALVFGKIRFSPAPKAGTEASSGALYFTRKDKPNASIAIEVGLGKAFLLQAIPGTYRFESFKYKGRYYRLGQDFQAEKGVACYLGLVDFKASGEKRESYGYEYKIDAFKDQKAFDKQPDIVDYFAAFAPPELAKAYAKASVAAYPSYPIFSGKGSEPKSLGKAAKDGDLATVTEYAKAKLPLDEPDQDGQTPLMIALYNGNSELAKFLLSKGSDITKKDSDGWQPLLHAFAGGALDAVPLLLGPGVDLNAKLAKGWTPLMFCARYDKGANAKLLLDGGADVNAAKDDGTTPLMLAIQYQPEEACLLLVDRGAKLDAKDSDEWSILYYALYYGKDLIARLALDSGFGLADTTKDGWTPLMCAIVHERSALAERLYAVAPRLDARNKDGWSAFHMALRYGAKELAKRMLQAGVDPSLGTATGTTPLMLALANGQLGMARLLIDRGAAIEARNTSGMTALMYALKDSYSDVARLLAEQSKDLDKPDGDGWTPLMYALRYGQADLASYLIDRKVRLDALDGESWSALSYALRYDQSAAAARLIAAGALLDVPNSNGWTPLMTATRYGQVSNAKALIAKGASLSAVNKYGWTALMLAISSDQADLAQLMVEKGASLAPKNSDGGDALSLAKAKGYADLAALISSKLPAEPPAAAAVAAPAAALAASAPAGKGATTTWDAILPKARGLSISSQDVINDSSGYSFAIIKVELGKAQAHAFFRDALTKAGWTITQSATSDGEDGATPDNPNVWGLLNAKSGTAHLIFSIDSTKFAGAGDTQIECVAMKEQYAAGLASDLLRLAPPPYETDLGRRFASKEWAVTVIWAKNEGAAILNELPPFTKYSYKANSGFSLYRVRLELQRLNGKGIKKDFLDVPVRGKDSAGNAYSVALAGGEGSDYFDYTKTGNQSFMMPVQPKAKMDYVFLMPEGSVLAEFDWPGMEPIKLWAP